MALAVATLRQERDPAAGWAVYRAVVESGAHPIDVPFFQAMLSFCRRALPSKAPDVLRAAMARGVPVCDRLFCTFLGACQRADPPLADAALDLYRALPLRTHDAIFGTANICRRAGSPDAALALVSDAIGNAVPFTERLLSLFAACCVDSSGAQAADTAARLLDLVRRRQIRPYRNPAVFANLVKAVARHGRDDVALDAIPLMEAIGLPASLRLYTLAQVGRFDDAMRVFVDLVGSGAPPDVTVFIALVAACSRSGTVASLDVLRDHARQHALLPVRNVLTAFVAAYGRFAGRAALVDLERMARDALLLHDPAVACAFIAAYDACWDVAAGERVHNAYRAAASRPDVRVLNTMIAVYSRHGMLRAALDAVEVLRAADLPWTQDAFVNVLAVLAKSDRVADAMRVFNDMRRRGDVHVDLAALSLLVGACGRARDRAALQALHAYASERDDVLLDDGVLGVFVVAYDGCDDLAGAEHVFRTRLASCVPFIASPFTAMMSAYARRRMHARAIDVFDAMVAGGRTVALDRATYAVMIPILADVGRVADALAAFYAMAKARTEVDVDVLTGIVDACGRCSQPAPLHDLLQFARRRLLLDDAVVGAFVQALSNSDRLDDAIDLFRSHSGSGCVRPFNAMIGAYAQHGRPADAFAVFARLKSEGVRPDADTLVALLSACGRAGDLAGASAVVQEFATVWQVPLESEHARTVLDDLHRTSKDPISTDDSNR